MSAYDDYRERVALAEQALDEAEKANPASQGVYVGHSTCPGTCHAGARSGDTGHRRCPVRAGPPISRIVRRRPNWCDTKCAAFDADG